MKTASRKIIYTFLLWVSIANVTSVLAQDTLTWKIHQPASSLTFNTTKASVPGVGGITETMQFSNFRGGISSNGRIELVIELNSIDSGIPIRNERLQNMFWNVAVHPRVSFSSQMTPEVFKKITMSNGSMDLMLDGYLNMVGQTKPIKAALVVTHSQGKLYVNTRKPVIINASDFGLNGGVEALRSIMGLNYLSSSVPVNFALELNKSENSKSAIDVSLPPSAW